IFLISGAWDCGSPLVNFGQTARPSLLRYPRRASISLSAGKLARQTPRSLPRFPRAKRDCQHCRQPRSFAGIGRPAAGYLGLLPLALPPSLLPSPPRGGPPARTTSLAPLAPLSSPLNFTRASGSSTPPI